MTTIPDILLFMKRIGAYHAQQLASIATHTKRSYNLIVANEPNTTAMQCVNLAIKRSTSRWMCILDDDCIILQDHWLDLLIEILEKHDDVALISCVEIKDAESLKKFQENPENFWPSDLVTTVELNWAAGYLHLFDREKVPDLLADEQIPGSYGMSDTDFCFQIKRFGYKLARTTKTVVYHPWKITDPEWRDKYSMVREEDELTQYNLQDAYMTEKWGVDYLVNRAQKTLSIIEE